MTALAFHAEVVAHVCSCCGAILPVDSTEAIAPLLERHLVKVCLAREFLCPALFAQLAGRVRTYEVSAALWRGQVGRA